MLRDITVILIAYNAEKFLYRSVNSILRQTHANWECAIIDHGSTDKTRKIIQSYAKNDPRFKPVYYDVNRGADFAFEIQVSEYKKVETPYVITLDADDEYKPTAFAEMLDRAVSGGFDVVCCGSEFAQLTKKKLQIIGHRLLNDELILKSPESYGLNLGRYYQFMRTSWGKLIRAEHLRHTDFSWYGSSDIYSDTSFVMSLAGNSENGIAILPRALHRYYVSPTSASYKLMKSYEGAIDFRIRADRNTYDKAVALITAKAGAVTAANIDFLQLVYMNSVFDSQNVLINADTSDSNKLTGFVDMFLNAHARKLAGAEHLGALCGDEAGQIARRRQLFAQITDWLKSRAVVDDAQTLKLCELGEFVSAVAEDGDAHIAFNQLRMKFLHNNNLNYKESITAMNIETSEKFPLLKGLSEDAIVYLRSAVARVLDNDLTGALDALTELANDEIPDEYAEAYITLGLNVSSSGEFTDAFIFFKKLQIEFLLDNARTAEARTELDEWLALLPDDEELLALSERLIELPPPVRLNNEIYDSRENPDLIPSYERNVKGLTIMNNSIDKRFYDLFRQIKTLKSVKRVTAEIIGNYRKLPDNYKQWLMSYYGGSGEFAPDKNNFELCEKRAKTLLNHADDIIWFYERLANYRSRYALFAYCHNWFAFGDLLGRVGKIRDDIYKEYLDFDVLNFGKDEVYADCGGFIGDSLADYLNEVGIDSYKKIYVYEFDDQNCDAINKFLRSNNLKNIVLRRKAVGVNGKLRYTPVAPGADRSGNSLTDKGEVEVEVVGLDSDILEPLTYIKMDIEGSEYAGIIGAQNHIQNEYPKLAICLYHKPDDIWELPRLIDALAPEYKFYLTFCGFALGHVGMAMLAVKSENKPENTSNGNENLGLLKSVILGTPPPARGKNVVVIGANERGVILKQAIESDLGDYNLVAFCDETAKNIGKSLQGADIISLNRVAELYRNCEIDTLILANTNFGYRGIMSILNQLGVPECYVVNQYFYRPDVEKYDLETELIRVDTSRS
ncbi:MAG: FkbM family methyltransferase [Oscillospiraceae bacterium]|jgi:FkbM family methyltransferase|nr:FkbM family methyltransferase [Oscillospiraceae bacterium]